MPLKIALGLQYRSPFKTAIDRKIKQFREAGLILKWHSDGEDSIGVLRLRGQKETRQNEALSLGDLQGLFYVTAIALALTTFVLASEVISWDNKWCHRNSRRVV